MVDALMPDRDPDTLRMMAVHEAGHAVVAMALGCDIVELRLEPKGGHCIHIPPTPVRSWHACSALAGVYACRVHCRDNPRLADMNSWDNCSDDWAQFMARRGGMTFRHARRLVMGILRDREAQVLLFADILERDGYLSHENGPAEYCAEDC